MKRKDCLNETETLGVKTKIETDEIVPNDQLLFFHDDDRVELIE